MSIYQQLTEQEIKDKLINNECDAVIEVHVDGSRTRHIVVDGKVQSTTTPMKRRDINI